MKTRNALTETFVNTFYGSRYYVENSVPKILHESHKWKSWNGKEACLVLSYDIDETADIAKLPKLLKLLKKYKIKAVFAAIGLLVERHPELFRKILRDGHEIINHTYSHPDSSEFGNIEHFHLISRKKRFDEIKKCHSTVKKMLKYDMRGFRIPHFGNQFIDDIYPMLKKLGYDYSSSTVAVRTDTGGFPYSVSGTWEFPMACCPKHPFCIFDTSHAFRSRFARHTPEDYIITFRGFLDFGIKNNMFMNLYHDPQDIDRFDYEKIIKMISANRKKLFITTYRKISDGLRRQG